MEERLRVAIIGCGGIGRVHAAAYVANQDLCQLVACCDTVAEAAEMLGQQYDMAAYTDVEQMLDESRPDAVSLCTPPVAHLPVAQQVAARGVALLCEKPLTRNLAEAQEMVALVESSGLVFMNALCHRFHGPVNQARELLQAGRLGKLIHFYNRFAFRFEGVAQRWFTDREVAGGGILLDTAVHSLDLFRYLVGEVSTIMGRCSTTLPVQVEDSAALLLQSVDGVTGDISCSWVTPPAEAIVRLYGTEGVAELDYSAKPNLRVRLAGGEWTPLPYEGPDRFVAETRHFLECVRTRQTPRITVRDGARAIDLIEQVYRG